jgi:hypothetical protein
VPSKGARWRAVSKVHPGSTEGVGAAWLAACRAAEGQHKPTQWSGNYNTQASEKPGLTRWLTMDFSLAVRASSNSRCSHNRGNDIGG